MALVLALAGLVLLWRHSGWLWLLGAAYAVVTVATVLADTRFGLWNKHLYFAAPGVALLAGYALATAADRRWRWPARALLAALMLASLHAWAVRVLFYGWSLRTL